ncbi:MAG: UDP-N-acetylglucosamine 2-epimerase (non-hydrolyzing) [Legionellales bacterium]|nr:UDP-N-acetylglucosamine 2-epimerase (non-hydrolyzing) [Legionellales bacterium]
MKVMSIFGTRPEMIKMWSTLRKLDALNFEHIMVHTSQNFTKELKDFFFHDLELRAPDFDLKIDTSSYSREVSDVLLKSEELFKSVKPDALLILGDTYSGLSIMPARHYGIKVFHMEAGMRAWDTRMPEQHNRVLIDHMSHILLPYNAHHRENLLRENIHPSKIFVTGNPTFEAMHHFLPKIKDSQILEELGLEPKSYFLVTAHRSENVDNPATLQSMLTTLGTLAAQLKREVIYPMHPRTQSKINETILPKGVRIMKPFGFYDFNRLFMDSCCVLSDSGTAPEEAYFYKVPCVSLRMTSERYETIEGGGCIISGLDPKNIIDSVITAISQPWAGRYDLMENFEPSSVVINSIRSQITNFF